ncbi:hypothetical protein ACTID9_01015 [Brevibacillus fluminis]|uniref:hypothetical protein n=1 Tax=Brevibacillus fluminis TaxID=511487 RepID=UPI003F8B0196
MNKVTKNLMKQARKRGQVVTFISDVEPTRCPCWSSDFQQPDAGWHESNPTAPLCNDNGYLTTGAETIDTFAFVLPYTATSRREIPQYSHYIDKLGPAAFDDHLLIAPELPEGAKQLKWNGVWHIHNPTPVYVGNEIGVWLTLVRRV